MPRSAPSSAIEIARARSIEGGASMRERGRSALLDASCVIALLAVIARDLF
jgi:hypothetical protein